MGSLAECFAPLSLSLSFPQASPLLLFPRRPLDHLKGLRIPQVRCSLKPLQTRMVFSLLLCLLTVAVSFYLRLGSAVIFSANALWARIQQVQDDPQAYSDPSQPLMELPFPFPGPSRPIDRFQFHNDVADIRTFTYMGRSRFTLLLKELPAPESDINAAIAARLASSSSVAGSLAGAASARGASASLAIAVPSASSSSFASPAFFPPISADAGSKSNTTFIYGTIGWGKSHLLAAMVCLLMRKGRKVVYLPDCKAMLRDPVNYFRSALLLTYASQPTVQAEVVGLLSIQDVILFCKRHADLTYIIDQYNSLEQDMQKDDTETLEKKKAAHVMIDRATFDRAVVLAASANNLTARVIHDKQLNMNIQTLFGGMDQVCSTSMC